MTDYAEPPAGIVARLSPLCLALPETLEEKAWVGMRWRVRKKTFAHVLDIGEGWAPADAAGIPLPSTVLTFRSSGPELDVLTHAGLPYIRVGWGRDVMGLVLDDATDWDEVAELLTESYCVMAPQKLAAQVDRPPD